MALITRRNALLASLAGGGLALAGCSRVTGVDALTTDDGFQTVLGAAETWTRNAQRFLLRGGALAREYSPKDISPRFRANGTLRPGGRAYAASAAQGFADWRLDVTGLVERPLSLSLAELRRLPLRTQITRHDCVEGWSAIGGWTGTPLALLLTAARVSPRARYAVFRCADALEGPADPNGGEAPGQYYESLALEDCHHPQTLIAWAMNGRPLDIAHGAPLRLRVERQLGYKQAKYVRRIELVESLKLIHGGKGGFWEDRGYEWYAGV